MDPRPDTVPAPAPTQRVSAERGRMALAVVFALNGMALASWISRIPAAREGLALTASGLGLLLLCMSVGAVAGLPLSGPVVHRLGSSTSVLVGGATVTVGLLVLAGGVHWAETAPAGAGLFLVGLGVGVWDVAMNIEGADVERRLERPLMPRLHAAFSLGTVAGALSGAAAAALGFPLAIHLLLTATSVISVLWAATRRFAPAGARMDGGRRAGSGVGQAWREPRTLLIGVLVLAFAFTEGTANDWLAVALVDGYGAGEVGAAVGFGVFVAAMTAVRLIGGTALKRWGPVATLRRSAAVALTGVLVFVLAPSLSSALVGALLWGAGAALGFPVGMSAAAEDPGRAAARVSVVSAIGYTAFLAGPPLVGFLADRAGVLDALLVVLMALVLGAAAAGGSRPGSGPSVAGGARSASPRR